MNAVAEAAARTPLDVRGTPFQRRAWRAMRRIPPGRVVSYGALALAHEAAHVEGATHAGSSQGEVFLHA